VSEKSSFGWGGLAVLLGLAAVVAVFFLFRGSDAVTLEEARAGETVRIGFANEAPYGYQDTDTGKVTGEAPEIARVILERLGVENYEMEVAKFGELIPGLKAGRLDIVAAGMYIKPERCDQVSFSTPTYRIGEAFIVKKGNPLDLHSFEDVAKHESARLGVMGGAVEHGYAKKLGVPEDRIVVFEDNPTAVKGLQSGRIDAVAATEATVTDQLAKADDPGIERAEPFSQPVIGGKTIYGYGYGAFAFREEADDWRKAFNKELETFIGSKEHLELVRPFGFNEDNLPGDVTTEQLCNADN